MATAFQSNAFQSNAFQAIPTISPSGWASSQFGSPTAVYNQYPAPTAFVNTQVFGTPTMGYDQFVSPTPWTGNSFGHLSLPQFYFDASGEAVPQGGRVTIASTTATNQLICSIQPAPYVAKWRNKWYAEVEYIGGALTTNQKYIGITRGAGTSSSAISNFSSHYMRFGSDTLDGLVASNGSASGTFANTIAAGTRIGLAVDADLNKWWLSINGTWWTGSYAFGTGGNPATAAGYTINASLYSTGIKVFVGAQYATSASDTFQLRTDGASQLYRPAGFFPWETRTANPTAMAPATMYGTLKIGEPALEIATFGIPTANEFGQIKSVMVAYQNGLLNQQEFGQLLTSMLVHCQSIDYTGVVSDLGFAKNRVDVVSNMTVVLTGPDESVVVETAEF